MRKHKIMKEHGVIEACIPPDKEMTEQEMNDYFEKHKVSGDNICEVLNKLHKKR